MYASQKSMRALICRVPCGTACAVIDLALSPHPFHTRYAIYCRFLGQYFENSTSGGTHPATNLVDLAVDLTVDLTIDLVVDLTVDLTVNL